RGRADGERPAERPDRVHDGCDRLLLFRGHRLDERPRECEAGRDGEAVANRLPEPDRLRAEHGGVGHLREREQVVHVSTVTSPAFPSTRTRAPSAMRLVASRVPTTPGMPYSRATMAEWERRPPLSVTIAPRSGRRMLNASVVETVTSTSPCSIRPNSVG